MRLERPREGSAPRALSLIPPLRECTNNNGKDREKNMGTRRGKPGPRPTLRSFTEDEFWEAKQNLSFTTLRGYRGDFRRVICPTLGEMRLNDIGRAEVQRMVNSAPSRKAARSAKGTLSSILTLAVDMGLIATNPAFGRYTLPREDVEAESPLGVWLTEWSQIKKVLEAARAWDNGGEIERACLAGYGFGLRKAEILGLNGEDFDLESKTLSVRRNYTRWEDGAQLHALKTKRSKRDLPIMRQIAERLQELEIGSGPFVTYLGKRSNPSTIAKHFAQFTKKSGLPHVTLATMRPSFASAALNSGMDIVNIRDWLGRTACTTTLGYCHETAEALRADSDRLSKAMESEDPAVMLPEPLIRFLTGRAEGLSDEERIMAAMLADPQISFARFNEQTGMSVSTLKRRVAAMQKCGFIARVGSRKDGLWAVFPALSNRYNPAA